MNESFLYTCISAPLYLRCRYLNMFLLWPLQTFFFLSFVLAFFVLTIFRRVSGQSHISTPLNRLHFSCHMVEYYCVFWWLLWLLYTSIFKPTQRPLNQIKQGWLIIYPSASSFSYHIQKWKHRLEKLINVIIVQLQNTGDQCQDLLKKIQ